LREEVAYFEELFREWNLTPSADSLNCLQTFVTRLLDWNVRINLTGARSRQELVSEHLVDSFAMTRFLPTGCSLADVGAGGGLPGIPHDGRTSRQKNRLSSYDRSRAPFAQRGGPSLSKRRVETRFLWCLCFPCDLSSSGVA
jgi:rRNA small subunit methyltransferase G